MVSNNRALKIASVLAGLVAGFTLSGIHAAEENKPLKVEYDRATAVESGSAISLGSLGSE
jgi:hypothetical protein